MVGQTFAIIQGPATERARINGGLMAALRAGRPAELVLTNYTKVSRTGLARIARLGLARRFGWGSLSEP